VKPATAGAALLVLEAKASLPSPGQLWPRKGLSLLHPAMAALFTKSVVLMGR
jgi:hypothetical protein